MLHSTRMQRCILHECSPSIPLFNDASLATSPSVLFVWSGRPSNQTNKMPYCCMRRHECSPSIPLFNDAGLATSPSVLFVWSGRPSNQTNKMPY